MNERVLSTSVKISFISLILILILGSVFILLIAPRLVKGNVVEVPNVKGKAAAEALRLIRRAGLRAVVTSKRFSNLVPEGHVIDQLPRAGMKMKLRGEVGLVISLGRDKINVPDLIGLPLDEAGRRLSTLDLRVGLRDYAYSSKPRGTIIAQTPSPGAVVARGDPIDLLISEGAYPEPMRMGDLRELSLKEAERLIRESGLKVGEVKFTQVEGHPPGAVVEHTPPPGEVVRVGDEIDLTVNASRGRGGEARPVVIRHIVSSDREGPVHVRIVVEHERGVERIVDGDFQPGQRIERLLFVVGMAKMRVYEDDMSNPVKEELVR